MADQTFELYTGSATGTQIDAAVAKVAAMEETLSGTAATISSSAAVKNYVDSKSVDTVSTLSGGVVYDISEANNGTTYANLAAALNNGNNIPASIRKGGISIKFIQSSDNKYVQFRYMISSTAVADFTNTANWQGVDDEPTAGSDNLVKSGGVFNGFSKVDNELGRFNYTTSFIPSYAINLGDYSLESVVSLTPVGNSVISYFLKQVSKGEKFILTGTGARNPRLYGILDTDRKLKAVANVSEQKSNFEINITEDGYLIVNVFSAQTYKLISYGLGDEIDELKEHVEDNSDAISDINDRFPQFNVVLNRGWYGTGGTLNGSNYRVYTDKFPQNALKLKLKDGFCFETILYYDSQDNRVFGWNTYTNYTRHYVDSPINEFESDGTYKCVFSIRRISEDTSETISTDPAYFIDSLKLIETDLYQRVENKAEKSDVDINLYNTIIWGAYINTNIDIGNIVNTTPVSNMYLYGYSILPCKKGEMFVVSGRGGGPSVAFVDSSYRLIKKHTVTYKSTVVAPLDGYIITNYTVGDSNQIIKKNSQYLNILNRSRWAALGDSITISYYSYFTDEEGDVGVASTDERVVYPYLAASMKNCEFTNLGWGSTGYKCGVEHSAVAIVDSTDFSNFDLVTLAYGINDYKAPSQVLGSMDDGVGGDVSVVANMRYCIEKIISDNPACKIVVITPLNARGYNHELGDEASDYAINHQNSLGYTLQDMFDKMVEVCEYYGIEYIDFTHVSVINRKSIRKLTPDGVHPSLEAHKALAKELINKLPI